MTFFRDSGVSSVLESLCIVIYTAVLCAELPCSHKKNPIFKGARKMNE